MVQNTSKRHAYLIMAYNNWRQLGMLLELLDDPEKTGVYEMVFSVVNFGEKALTYDIGAYVFTEGVSETLTNAGKTTVTEEAYTLEGAAVEITNVDGGELKDTKLTVDAGSEAKVTMTVTVYDFRSLEEVKGEEVKK